MVKGSFAATLFTALSFGSAAGQPNEAPPSVFGLAVNQTLSIPECPRDGSIALPDLCFVTARAFIGTAGRRDATLMLLFGVDKQPYWVAGITVSTENDIVKSVVVSTKGHAVQNDVYQLLVAKFGKATWVHRGTKYGLRIGTIDYTQAQWTRTDASIFFEGVTDRIDQGVITLRAPTSQADDTSTLKM